MAGPEKIGAISRRVTSPVDAVKLYAATNQYTNKTTKPEEGNPFNGFRNLGLFQWNYGEGGQIDPTQYSDNGDVYHQNTICWA
jgi:hypothetical protein